jgi:hypothetical protein
MKRLYIILLTTGVALFLALAGCGGSNGEPEPVPPPADTVVVEEPVVEPPSEPSVEEPVDHPDTTYAHVPEWSEFWWANYTSLNANMGCLNLAFRKSDNAEDPETMSGNIVGTWKLLIQFDYHPESGEPCPTDYSCRSVLYVFDADTTLTLISDTTAIPSGKFKYAFSGNIFCVGIDLIPELSIGEEGIFCLVADQMMKTTAVNYIYVDGIKYIGSYGERRYFLKIKN